MPERHWTRLPAKEGDPPADAADMAGVVVTAAATLVAYSQSCFLTAN
jgi:hypothetical protein